MDNKILMLSLSRSGHHAVAEWICGQLDGSVLFLNNCTKGWEDGAMIPYSKKKENYDNDGDGQSEMFTLETFDMDNFQKYKMGDRGFTMVVLVIRDIYNWVASCFKIGGEGKGQVVSPFDDERGDRKLSTICLWKKQAKQIINQNVSESIFPILYDKWFESKEYRDEIANTIGFSNTDKGIMTVSQYGWGSSFDGFSYQGYASRMDVLNRWKLFVKDQEYIKMFDEECHDLNEQLFGVREPWK